jgi:homocitrate synthase NifV
VELVDTTLRDGEQTAGIVFSADEKLDMVRALNAIGIGWIEAGIPAMGPDEREVLKEMLRVNKTSAMIAWNRADKGDIANSISCGFQFIHVSLPASDFHIEHKLRKSREWVLARLREVLAQAKGEGASLIVGAEDASRADPEFFLRFADAAASCGAIRIRYADTVGCMEPFTAAEIFSDLAKRSPLPIEFHGHNDLGLAVANTLAACQNGIPYASVTSIGIGERAGNASLEDFAGVMRFVCRSPLKLRMEHLPKLASIVRGAARRKQCPQPIYTGFHRKLPFLELDPGLNG